jgi:hypothetical protein
VTKHKKDVSSRFEDNEESFDYEDEGNEEVDA